jgi:hypothetical protein
MPEEPPAPRAELKKVIRHLIEQQHKKAKTTAPVPPLPSQRRLVSEREPAETTATPVQPRPSRQPATAEPETAARAPRSTDAEAATNSSKLEELERRAQEFRERMQLHGHRPVLSQAAPQGHLNRKPVVQPRRLSTTNFRRRLMRLNKSPMRNPMLLSQFLTRRSILSSQKPTKSLMLQS